MKTPIPRIQIGNFTIYQYDDGTVWIEEVGGEGGGFAISELEKVIQEFYEKHF